jgi:hypothetical protein
METQSTPSYSAYSPVYGLKFLLPNGWTLEENIGFGGVQLFTPDEEMGHHNPESVSILVRPQDNLTDINPTVLGYITNELIKSNYQSFKSFILLNLQQREINNLPAREMLFAYKDSNKDVNMGGLQIVFVKRNKLYLITYTAPDVRYGRFLEMVNTVIANMVVE